jgi:hypothetical protein
MDDNIIDKLLQNLHESKNVIHVDDLDVTWDLNNLLVNSTESLSILLAKTSCLPLVPNFTEPVIYQTIGITQEQSNMVQEFNEQLISIHGIVEKYCVQQYVIQSIIKKMMDDIILNLPETDMTYLLDFIKTYHENKNNNLIGGQKGMHFIHFMKIVIYLFFIVCFVSPLSIDKQTDELSLIDTSKKTYSLGLVQYSVEQFTQELMIRDPNTSGKMSVNNLVAKYDDNIKEELNTVFGLITDIFSKKELGNQRLQRIINDFNKDSRYFSREVEETCIELMVNSKEHGIFNDFTDIDTLKDTEKKIENIENLVKQQTDNIKQGILGSVTGAVISGVAATLTGDTVTPYTYIADAGSNIYDYISNTKKNIQEKKQTLTDQKSITENIEETSKIMSESEKLEFESKIFVFSKLYCSLGYNLQIGTSNNLIEIIGDKVPYTSMVNLITTLEKNLAFQITKLSTDKLDDTTKYTVMSLVSLQQRLSILKKITDSLYTIVNFSAKIQILKMESYSTPTTMGEFEEYLKDQLSKVKELLINLNKRFPLRETQLEEKKKNIEEDIELMSREANIQDMIQNATSYARQRSVERMSKENADWWLSTKTIGSSWIDLGLNSTMFVKEGLGKYTEAFTDLAAEGPLSVIKSIIKFLNKILYELFTNPAGWTLIMAGLSVISFMTGGITGTIRIFKQSGKLILTIAIGSFMFVYELIKTPFGFIYRNIGTLFLPSIEYGPSGKENYVRFIKNQEEGEIYDPTVTYGGKVRKYKKTRKNKRDKTRKLKRGKRRYTRYRKKSSTKRH